MKIKLIYKEKNDGTPEAITCEVKGINKVLIQEINKVFVTILKIVKS